MYEQIADKITKFVLATLKKEKLLDMAANGSPRPESKTLAKALSKYVEHDPKFASDIKNLRPHWFAKDISLSPLETSSRGCLAPIAQPIRPMPPELSRTTATRGPQRSAAPPNESPQASRHQ